MFVAEQTDAEPNRSVIAILGPSLRGWKRRKEEVLSRLTHLQQLGRFKESCRPRHRCAPSVLSLVSTNSGFSGVPLERKTYVLALYAAKDASGDLSSAPSHIPPYPCLGDYAGLRAFPAPGVGADDNMRIRVDTDAVIELFSHDDLDGEPASWLLPLAGGVSSRRLLPGKPSARHGAIDRGHS